MVFTREFKFKTVWLIKERVAGSGVARPGLASVAFAGLEEETFREPCLAIPGHGQMTRE